ncbi:protein containing DUF1814 [mine drainage metagenome]|uniref:Protein containing DUF1814 n=1 Tax=mine drainage metagenome TaxID=410659 RepID=T1AWF5_9ZZZZ
MMGKDALLGYKTFRDPYQIEKDYLQDILLYSIYKKSSNELVLKGGTAFSKFYFSDRFSEDLDFTLTYAKEGAIEYAKDIIERATEQLEYKYRYKEAPEANEYGTVGAILLIEGPRYNGKESTLQQLQFEISTAHKLVMDPGVMARNPVYADAKSYTALVMQPDEIIAEKLRALVSPGRRHKERDLYDVYHFVGKGAEIIKRLVNAKLSEVNIDVSCNDIVKAIDSVRTTWDDLEPFVQHPLQRFEEVKILVVDAVKKALE